MNRSEPGRQAPDRREPVLPDRCPGPALPEPGGAVAGETGPGVARAGAAGRSGWRRSRRPKGAPGAPSAGSG